MHNKHAEEAERIVTACKIGHVMSDCRFAGCMCFVGQLKEAITQSLHSAVQKEREEFAEAVKKAVVERLDADPIWKIIDRIKSDREKGE